MSRTAQRGVSPLLCNGCNRGMGYLDDDSNKLRAAAEYLDRHAQN